MADMNTISANVAYLIIIFTRLSTHSVIWTHAYCSNQNFQPTLLLVPLRLLGTLE